MTSTLRIVLTSFQDGRAVLHINYGGRSARVELDQLEDRYPGQPTAERAREEIASLVETLRTSLQRSELIIEQA